MTPGKAEDIKAFHEARAELRRVVEAYESGDLAEAIDALPWLLALAEVGMDNAETGGSGDDLAWFAAQLSDKLRDGA